MPSVAAELAAAGFPWSDVAGRDNGPGRPRGWCFREFVTLHVAARRRRAESHREHRTMLAGLIDGKSAERADRMLEDLDD